MFPKRLLIFSGVFLTSLLPILIRTNDKNTCVTYFDYLLSNFGGNCYYNPDVDLGVPEIIKKYTGSVRSYNVITEDGYVLTMFRIFRENPVGVVLMQPPISAGSIAYLSDGDHSIAIALWKKGYDVWLSNHRGVSYSRRHINLTESDPAFWNYSFHEIAMYDLEAQFRLINAETRSKIIYIGYSIAATEALIYASMKPENAEKYVDSFVLIAPLAIMKHFKSYFQYILKPLLPLENFFRMGEFMTFEMVRMLAQPITVVPFVLNIVGSVLMGWTPTEMDPELYPFIFAHHGRGMTYKMIYHYGQIFYNRTHFSMYDYGQETNKLVYGSDFPPYYPLQGIQNPMYIIYGDRDELATPLDINILCEELLPKDKVYAKISIPNHNHIDFMFSRHRRKKTYEAVFNIMESISNNTPE